MTTAPTVVIRVPPAALPLRAREEARVRANLRLMRPSPASLTVFRDMRESELVTLASLFRYVFALPGQVIVRQGEPADSFYTLVHGCLAVTVETDNPRKTQHGFSAEARTLAANVSSHTQLEEVKRQRKAILERAARERNKGASPWGDDEGAGARRPSLERLGSRAKRSSEDGGNGSGAGESGAVAGGGDGEWDVEASMEASSFNVTRAIHIRGPDPSVLVRRAFATAAAAGYAAEPNARGGAAEGAVSNTYLEVPGAPRNGQQPSAAQDGPRGSSSCANERAHSLLAVPGAKPAPAAGSTLRPLSPSRAGRALMASGMFSQRFGGGLDAAARPDDGVFAYLSDAAAARARPAATRGTPLSTQVVALMRTKSDYKHFGEAGYISWLKMGRSGLIQRGASIVAVEPSAVLEMPASHFTALFDLAPGISERFASAQEFHAKSNAIQHQVRSEAMARWVLRKQQYELEDRRAALAKIKQAHFERAIAGSITAAGILSSRRQGRSQDRRGAKAAAAGANDDAGRAGGAGVTAGAAASVTCEQSGTAPQQWAGRPVIASIIPGSKIS